MSSGSETGRSRGDRRYSSSKRRGDDDHRDRDWKRRRTHEEGDRGGHRGDRRRSSREEHGRGKRSRSADRGDRRSGRRRRSSGSGEDSDRFEDDKFRSIRQLFRKYIKIEREVPLDEEDSEMMRWNTLPCFDRVNDFEGIELRRKFFEDVQAGDVIACKVLEINDDDLELKPECTMTRYRRCLYRIPFPVTTVKASCDADLIACTRGNIIGATVSYVDQEQMKLYLTVNNYGIPLKDDELPAYYRKLPELSVNDPDLEHKIGLAPLRTTQSLHNELIRKHMDNPRGGPEALRLKALEQQAADFVQEAAAAVKNGQNKDGISIFTKALDVVPNFVAALTGRAAAYANESMFEEALTDLRIAHQLDPEDETSSSYLSTVLMVYGQQKEETGDLELARECYKEALEVSDDNRARVLLSDVEKRRQEAKDEEAKKNTEQEDRKKEKRTRKEQRENSKKLRKMEDFIASLKKEK